jgi:hypothetical protein
LIFPIVPCGHRLHRGWVIRERYLKKRIHSIINVYALAFFDKYLQGQDSSLLSGSSPKYPEVEYLPAPACLQHEALIDDIVSHRTVLLRAYCAQSAHICDAIAKPCDPGVKVFFIFVTFM